MKVSVCMIAYNHQRWVAQALDSVLAQRAAFPVEIVIGDDASTDRTAAVIADYAARYPGRFTVLPHDEHLGAMPNFMRTLRAADGDYVALLECDDYWTDPDKLRLQVEVLEGDPTCALCCHDIIRRYEASGREELRVGTRRERIEAADLFAKNLVFTSSVVFRNAHRSQYPRWFDQLIPGDWTLFIWLAQLGHIQRLPRPMSCYRIHGSNSWFHAGREMRTLRVLEVFEALRDHFRGAGSNPRLAELAEAKILDLDAQLAVLTLLRGAPGVSRDHVRRCLTRFRQVPRYVAMISPLRHLLARGADAGAAPGR